MADKTLNKMETFADKVINWVGSTASLVVHTILFVTAFILPFFGFDFEKVLLVVTTLVSLEAIYLAIFIQISINRANKTIQGVEEDIDEIQEDIDEIQEDVDEIQEDMGEINEDIDELQSGDEEDNEHHKLNKEMLDKIRTDLSKMVEHIEELKRRTNNK